ncbi:MAG: triose-phosphate isomerase [bacterium]|nr:triose-phosphate isomerase [bacterium]
MKPIIIANWKMNPLTSRGAFVLAKKVAKGAKGYNATVVLCPPYVFIPQLPASKNVQIGAQNCSWEQKGALTGEVSPFQLKSLGCTFVILGHSERKKYLAETLGMVQAKAEAALQAGLKVILCVENVRELQMIAKNMKSFKNILVVFEPSSAISTQGGKRITPGNISTMAQAMKKVVGKNVPILYGGSVDAKSITSIMKVGKVHGVLIGAASLDAKEFLNIIKEVN